MAMIAHNVEIKVFSKEDEDYAKINEMLIKLVPLDLEKEKISIKEETAIGFSEKKIKILTLTLDKQRHVTRFISFLRSSLTQEQKDLLVRQAESRLDDEMSFFIRFDKGKWMDESVLWLTDGGYCYHVKMTIAAYPAKREIALGIVRKMFSPE